MIMHWLVLLLIIVTYAAMEFKGIFPQRFCRSLLDGNNTLHVWCYSVYSDDNQTGIASHKY